MSRIGLPAAVALALTVLGGSGVFGCGGSSARRPSADLPRAASSGLAPPRASAPTAELASSRPLPRSIWIAKGDAICAHINAKVSASTVASAGEYPRILPQLALYEWIEARELATLVPPRRKRGDWAQIVADVEVVGDYMSRSVNAYRNNDQHVLVNTLRAAEGLHEKLDAMARRDGFGECSRTRVRHG